MGASDITGARNSGAERYAANAAAYLLDQGVGRAGRCVSPRRNGESIGLGGTDASEVDAARAGPEDRASSHPWEKGQ